MGNFRCCKHGLLLCVGLLLNLPLAAQEYPGKAVTFTVPYPAGGGTDVVARSLAEQMARQLGRPVVVDNKPGAGGILGTHAVVKAAANGHTVLIGLTQSVLTNQFLYSKLPYDPRKDLAFVSQIAIGPLLLLVPANSPVQSPGDLRRMLKTSKGAASCGSWGAGSYPHLACAHMASSLKTTITHVAYKGEAPMLQDLVGGQLTFALGSLTSAKPYMDGGRLRALAVTGEQRMPALAGVPTFAEGGMPDPEYRVTGWIAMLVPLATPRPVVDRLQQAVQQAVGSPELKQRFEALGMVAVGNTAEQFRQRYAADWPVWERLVKVSGAKLD
ncbi:tripartite tricarboxylate transporter substrate binding protein [Polaromonas sp. P2-4]|nr:tripartite tricarboxylate transporter substrate binding protein [Polaromonas sp. P2-4]